MFIRGGFLSLTLHSLFNVAASLDLDVNSQDSIKSAAKTLAGGIVAAYNDNLGEQRVPGIFSESGEPYYWWEAGSVFETLIDYSYLAGDDQYNDLITAALVHQLGDYYAFMPQNQTKTLGNSDQSSWGLAAMAAAENGFPEPDEELQWIDIAKNVFDAQSARWDNTTCGGGLRWQIFTFNAGYDYKNSPSASQFFLLAARLARFTGNSTFSEWAEKSFDWSKTVGLISDDFHVFDGTDSRGNCSEINQIQWTSDHGIYTEGAAIMYKLTGGSDKWNSAMKGFINSSSVFQDESVLTEVACEENGKCNVDQRSFKGMAARSFARATWSAPLNDTSLNNMLQTSAKAAAKNCEGENEDLECAFKWTGDGDDKASVNDEGLGEAFNALSVVQGLLWPQQRAVGENSTSPNPSPSGGGNGTSSGTPSGTAAPTEATGAAGTVGISGGLVFLVAMLALHAL